MGVPYRTRLRLLHPIDAATNEGNVIARQTAANCCRLDGHVVSGIPATSSGRPALPTIKNNAGSLSKLSDLVHDLVIGIEIDPPDSCYSPVVVSLDVVAEQYRGREGADLFGEYFLPATAQMVFQKFANCGVDPRLVANPFKPVERMTAVVCQADFQCAA